MKDSFNTACGTAININEATAKHLEAHPEAAELLGEAIGRITLGERSFVLQEVDMGRVIGRSALVDAPEVAHDQTTLFACRTGRDIPSRVMLNVEKPETSIFTVIAGKQDGSWNLYTGFAGPSAPREPHDSNLNGDNSNELQFWCSHALVHDAGWSEPFESTWDEVLAAVVAKRAA